jgi:hypothetical protein
VAFEGKCPWSPVPDGIYTNIDGSLDWVADTTTSMPDDGGTFGSLYFGVPSISGNNIVFTGGNQTQRGVYAHINGALQVIADLDTPRPGANDTFEGFFETHIEGNDVVFSKSLQDGIYTTLGGTLRLVADESTVAPGQSQPFNYLAIPTIEGSKVLFMGSGPSPGAFPSFFEGFYLERDGELSVLIDNGARNPSDPWGRNFVHILGFSYDGVHLAFGGSWDDPGYGERWGLYADFGEGLIKVLDANDTLDGKMPIYFDIHSQALSGNKIAFNVHFADQSEGIYVAHYTPSNS